MIIEQNKESVSDKNYLVLSNSLKRLDFYYECVKQDVEDIVMGMENIREATNGLDSLASEIDDIANDVRSLAHRLREKHQLKKSA